MLDYNRFALIRIPKGFFDYCPKSGDIDLDNFFVLRVAYIIDKDQQSAFLCCLNEFQDYSIKFLLIYKDFIYKLPPPPLPIPKDFDMIKFLKTNESLKSILKTNESLKSILKKYSPSYLYAGGDLTFPFERYEFSSNHGPAEFFTTNFIADCYRELVSFYDMLRMIYQVNRTSVVFSTDQKIYADSFLNFYVPDESTFVYDYNYFFYKNFPQLYPVFKIEQQGSYQRFSKYTDWFMKI